MLIVQVCDFGEDGDALYRAHAPSRELGRLPGITSVDCHFLSRHLPDLARRADILLTHFVNDWDFLELCLARKAGGKVTVFEANDYYLDIQPWNPRARSWADGTLAELLRCFVTLADGVQTSTDQLARRWQEMGASQVAAFPNQLTDVPDLPPPPQRPLTIGWGGSAGHLADWYDVAPALERWLLANPNARLAVMSAEPAKAFFNLPPDRYSFTPLGTMDQYLRFLRGIDIGVAPLLPTAFNRGRSDAKFLEYASNGVAGIYTDLEPYRGSVVPGETGLLFRDHQEMIAQIQRLATDPDLRKRIRQNAHDYVRQHRRLSDHITARLSWYQSLLTRASTQTAPSPVENTQYSAVGGYHQVRPEEPEHALRVALHAPTPGEAISRLDPLVAAFPQYYTAQLHHGILLNNLRRYPDAISRLTRAAELEPHRARAQAEIGRAWFHLNDHANARRAMELAVHNNPYHLPAWQYLLRMLAATKSVDASEWARRAVEVFPNCRSIALLAAATVPAETLLDELANLLDRFAPEPSDIQRPSALAEFRRAIRAAISTTPFGPRVLTLLEKACKTFPESKLLAGDFGSALIPTGRIDEGYSQHARALQLDRAAAVDRDDSAPDGPPIAWQLAEHIRHYRSRT